MSYYLRIDDKMRNYSREAEKFLAFLGDIGGLFEIVSAIGFLFTAPFVMRSMNAAMINEVYHIQKYSNDNSTLKAKG